MIRRIIKKFKEYRFHVKQVKEENKGFVKVYNSAMKKPAFYLILVIGTLLSFLVSNAVIEGGKSMSNEDLSILIFIIFMYFTSRVLFNWIEEKVLKPKGFSFGSKKVGKKL